MSSERLESFQNELIEHSMAVGALKFGQFTLKSGRVSPYFFNAALLSTGSVLSTLANAYASTIISAQLAPLNPLPQFDVIFGPAYKGIPFAACTTVALHAAYGVSVGFAYNRKEVKDHGEGGILVGVPIDGKRVLILDDVMTAGTAVMGAIEMIREEGGDVVGVVQLLDREEVGKKGGSTVEEVENEIGGKGRVKAVLRMRDLMKWLENAGQGDVLERMQAYWEQYGVKE